MSLPGPHPLSMAQVTELPVPPELAKEVEAKRAELVEIISEVDDEVRMMDGGWWCGWLMEDGGGTVQEMRWLVVMRRRLIGAGDKMDNYDEVRGHTLFV